MFFKITLLLLRIYSLEQTYYIKLAQEPLFVSLKEETIDLFTLGDGIKAVGFKLKNLFDDDALFKTHDKDKALGVNKDNMAMVCDVEKNSKTSKFSFIVHDTKKRQFRIQHGDKCLGRTKDEALNFEKCSTDLEYDMNQVFAFLKPEEFNKIKPTPKEGSESSGLTNKSSNSETATSNDSKTNSKNNSSTLINSNTNLISNESIKSDNGTIISSNIGNSTSSDSKANLTSSSSVNNTLINDNINLINSESAKSNNGTIISSNSGNYTSSDSKANLTSNSIIDSTIINGKTNLLSSGDAKSTGETIKTSDSETSKSINGKINLMSSDTAKSSDGKTNLINGSRDSKSSTEGVNVFNSESVDTNNGTIKSSNNETSKSADFKGDLTATSSIDNTSTNGKINLSSEDGAKTIKDKINLSNKGSKSSDAKITASKNAKSELNDGKTTIKEDSITRNSVESEIESSVNGDKQTNKDKTLLNDFNSKEKELFSIEDSIHYKNNTKKIFDFLVEFLLDSKTKDLVDTSVPKTNDELEYSKELLSKFKKLCKKLEK